MKKSKKAAIALADGSYFEGSSFGAEGEAAGEIVFNTSMTGYQEIISDPSYHGQIVLFTYPLLGNYGTNKNDAESPRLFARAVIAAECTRFPSGTRCRGSLSRLLEEEGIPGIEGIDTRRITLKIRHLGSMKAAVSTSCFSREKLVEKARNSPDIAGRDLVKEVTCKKKYIFSGAGQTKIAVLDCGVKLNTLRELSSRNCAVSVYPAGTGAGEILAGGPSGVLVSNGPGDPEAVPYAVDTVKQLAERAPVFGICLGHQLICLALGAKTVKLKFGHHGANHPVKDLRNGKIFITSQNHNFCVREDTLPGQAAPAYTNLYDGTLEGIRHKSLPLFSVQFHPEAGPGPNDARHIFDEFIKLAGGGHA